MGKHKDHLLWLDMEMTGLEPRTCVPLQIAIIVTDGQLVEQDAVEFTIFQPEEALAGMPAIVKEMHTKNGLLEAVRKCNTSLEEAEEGVMELLRKWFDPREAILCGNSIHQDRRFIRKYFRKIEEHLHYRMVDVSTIKELSRRWYGPNSLYTKGDCDHTALADVRLSVEEMAHYRAAVFRQSDGQTLTEAVKKRTSLRGKKRTTLRANDELMSGTLVASDITLA